MKFIKNLFSTKKSKIIGIIVSITMLLLIVAIRESVIYNHTVEALGYGLSTQAHALNVYGTKLAKDSDKELSEGTKLETAKSKLDSLYKSIDTFSFFKSDFRKDVITYVEYVNDAYNKRTNIDQFNKCNQKVYSLKASYSNEFTKALDIANKN